MGEKPFSQACENNKGPILEVLRRTFENVTRVLEIGSGTGQHAVHFAANLPHLTWLPSDLMDNHPGIHAWIEEFPAPNLLPPTELDVRAASWPAHDIDAVFTANTAHILYWPDIVRMFSGVAGLLPPGGIFVLYGPFNYDGSFTSASNARFDRWLRTTDPEMGIRDFEAMEELAGKGGMSLAEDVAMPANNRILVWRKRD